MPLSMKTMEVQIKGDQWNKRFRTMQFYCKGEAHKMSGMERGGGGRELESKLCNWGGRVSSLALILEDEL